MKAMKKFYLGFSVNHKKTDKHNELLFKNQTASLEKIIEHIKENGFFYPPITKDLNRNLYGVQEAYKFTETQLIPFDFDKMKCSMEDYLEKLPVWLKPTVAFKTIISAKIQN